MVWNEQCQEAFEKIKNYLMKPPILVPPVPEKPLLLYLTIQIQLAQYLEESRKENKIYYINKNMLAYEEKHSSLEKTCRTCMRDPQTQTLHACFQSLIDCKNGPFEISNGKAYAR